MTYLDPLADLIRACLPPDAEPPEESAALFRMYAVLLKAKGAEVTDEDVHDAWSAWMQTVNRAHEALIPYDDLDPATRAFDAPYAEAIRRAARQMSR
ncbi:hypothetical protein ABZY01_32775 [Streptomyces anthocyanicus]|uniref:DUF7701 domain-containing protein n=1 Tax=Streptomyces rubrogriseus TaxID=194673 RepID=A0A6G3TQW5_9ACTN|nr:hypothetical protein [Streptomyces rubrogriseus]